MMAESGEQAAEPQQNKNTEYTMTEYGGQAVVLCQMCEQSSQIKKKCIECDFLLCINCCQLNKKIKALLDHQLVDLHDIGSIKGSVAKINFKNIDCRNHAEEKCCLFCEDCGEIVCSVCISEKHNQHKMVQIEEGHKLCKDKISKWCADTKTKIKKFTKDLSTLDTIYATENSKYITEKEKIFGQDKVLKGAVDKRTKTFVSDLDQRWNKIDQSIKKEMIHADKYKQCLQSREEQLNQALESNNGGNVYRTMDEVMKQKRYDRDKPLNLKFETIPTFQTREINHHAINSLYGSLLDNNKKIDVKNIKISTVESYNTEFSEITSLQCNANGTIWISNYLEDELKCSEKQGNRTLITRMKFEISAINMALTPQGDLLLSVVKPNLLVIRNRHQTILKSQYSVPPLVTTGAIHVSSNKIIVGAREPGPLYPSRGSRQIIVMDTQGKHEKVYQYDGNKKPLFTNPRKVTADSKNNIYVLDRQYDTLVGRVIIINKQNGKIIVYNGNPKVNNQDNPLSPGDLVAMTSDNIVVSDKENHTLHILNSNGECVKYINTEEHGIRYPWSLDIDKRNLLHIGCYKKKSVDLHVVKFTGF